MSETKEQKEEPQKEDWEVQRDHHKALADTAFRSKNYKDAIEEYSNAITFDPEFHILYSNRSAAYLVNGEKSRALQDAKKCVQLKPEFVKGHGRLAASMMSLGRWNEARNVYKHILSNLDKDNASAQQGIRDCRERELKAKEAEMEILRKAQEEKEKAAAARSETEANEEEKPSTENKEEGDEEDDLLNDFFDEVEDVKPVKKQEVQEEKEAPKENKIQIQLSDLGDTSTQIERLLRPNHEWFNLNPFAVLDISHEAPLELLSRRYKALSLILHPDKVRNTSNNNEEMVRKAEEAFEYIRKAMNSLKDEDKAKHFRDLVEQGMKQGQRDFDADSSAGTLKSCQDKATLKIFAEIEHKRRDVERRKRNQEQRERDQEDTETNKIKKDRDFEKQWKEGDRVEKRIGNWRDFAKKKKSRF